MAIPAVTTPAGAIDVGTVGLWSMARQWPAEAEARAGIAAEIEALGFGAVWIGVATADLELPAALLEATGRLVVATGILNVWTEPVDAVVDHYGMIEKAHPRRLLLGIGAGHAKIVEALTGRRYERPYQALVDYLDAFDRAGVPREARILAALGPRVLRLAAERSRGAHPYLVTPAHTCTAREIMGPEPLLAPEQKVILDTDPARARRTARQALAMYLELPNYTNNLRRLGFTDDDLSGGGSDRLVDALVAWGDVEAIRARIGDHVDAGADHVCVQLLSTDATLPRAGWRELAGGLGLS